MVTVQLGLGSERRAEGIPHCWSHCCVDTSVMLLSARTAQSQTTATHGWQIGFPMLIGLSLTLWLLFSCCCVQAKNGREVRSFYTMPEYESWKESLGPAASRWEIKYYKGLGTSTPTEAKEYFARIDQHRKEFVWEGKCRKTGIYFTSAAAKIGGCSTTNHCVMTTGAGGCCQSTSWCKVCRFALTHNIVIAGSTACLIRNLQW